MTIITHHPPDEEQDEHLVRCQRCGRPLHNDKAVRRGTGWRCAAHRRHEAAA